MSEMQSCLAGGTHKTADIRADVAEWRRRRADHVSCCEICHHSPADTITLHCSADPWDSTQPYTVHLCRDHQGGLIDAVRDGVKMMKEARNANGNRH